MSNLTVNRLGPEAQADSVFDDYDYEVKRYVANDVKPQTARPLKKDEIIAWGIVGVPVWALLMLVFGVLTWATNPASYETPTLWYVLFSGLFALVAASPVLLGIGALGLKLYNSHQDGQVQRLRSSLVRDKWMNPVDARLISSFEQTQYAGLWRASADVEVAVAPYRQLRGVESLSQSANHRNDGATGTPALPDGGLNVGPVPVATWLPWLDEPPHLMFAAESGGGKSVLASVVVNGRVQRRGDAVAILDPHYSPMVEADEGRLVPKWGGIKPVATNHQEIRRALIDIRAEYDDRMEQLREGLVVEGRFPPLTIVIDEVPEVVAELKKLDGRGQDTWADTAQVLGSGARKVNIAVILLTQSPLVEDIGLNSAMRKNFYRVALKHAEVAFLLKDENNQERRKAVLAAVEGQRFPAAVIRDGQAWGLDRNGLLGLMPQTINARAWGQLDDGLTDSGDELLVELLGTTGTSFQGADNGRITTPLDPVPAVPGHPDAENAECGGSADKEAEVRTLARLTEMSGNEIARKVGLRKARVLELVREVRG